MKGRISCAICAMIRHSDRDPHRGIVAGITPMDVEPRSGGLYIKPAMLRFARIQGVNRERRFAGPTGSQPLPGVCQKS